MTKNVVIFDIDGTLADGEHRQHHVRPVEGKKKNWPAYNDGMANDRLHLHVAQMYWTLRDNKLFELYIVSGREDQFRDVTENWLFENRINSYKALYMRKTGDYRGDDLVKEEILNTHFDKSKILCVFDDRPRVIRMWRRNGIPVFDCGLGIEF